MITAKEARDIADASDARMEKRLDKIGEKVKDAANAGKRELILDYAITDDDAFKMKDAGLFRPPEFTPLQLKMRDKLKEYGFSLEIKMVRTKIRGGLGSLDDEIEHEDVPHLYIRW